MHEIDVKMAQYDEERRARANEIGHGIDPSSAHSALAEIFDEYKRARSKHGPMRGPHEGYAVLLEEVDELWDEVKGNNPERARKEVIQVAAMALGYLIEVSPPRQSDHPMAAAVALRQAR